MKVTVFRELQKRLSIRSEKIFLTCLAALLLAVGYMAGYWTSETQKQVPIVFKSQGEQPRLLTDQDIAELTAVLPKVSEEKDDAADTEQKTELTAASKSTGSFVASISGTKYYTLSCSEVNRIKEENKVYFTTAKEAEESGFEPSACVLKK